MAAYMAARQSLPILEVLLMARRYSGRMNGERYQANTSASKNSTFMISTTKTTTVRSTRLSLREMSGRTTPREAVRQSTTAVIGALERRNAESLQVEFHLSRHRQEVGHGLHQGF